MSKYITLVIKTNNHPPGPRAGDVAFATHLAQWRDLNVLAAWLVNDYEVCVVVSGGAGPADRVSAWFIEGRGEAPFPAGELLLYTFHNREFNIARIGEDYGDPERFGVEGDDHPDSMEV